MPLYDFLCPVGHRTELLRAPACSAVRCPTCDAEAVRQIPRFAIAVGADTAWASPVREANGRIRVPVAQRPIHLRQYTEATEQLAYEHARAEESAQRTLPSPPLGQIAIRRARQLMKAGIKDSLDMPK